MDDSGAARTFAMLEASYCNGVRPAMTTCPKCHYTRQAIDAHVHEGLCPACGIAYAKWSPPQETDPSNERDGDGEFAVEEESLSSRRRFIAMITCVPERVDPALFWGRVVLFVLFFIWGWSFILGGISWERIGGSFLHNVNLPFHEFGHVLFGFFGRFMGILGGSLFQILVPLIFTVAFCWQRHDNFAAAITLWWCGQNFIDVSPYIADAPYRAIPLIRGLDEEYHDWGNLLTMTDSLDSAGTLAAVSFGIGVVIMLTSFAWGGWILCRQKQRIDRR